MNDLIELAKVKANLLTKKRRSPKYRRAVEWLGFVGLLRHSEILPRESKVRLADLLFAAELEPRIRELLPALIAELGDLLPFHLKNVPQSLVDISRAKDEGRELPLFQNIPASRYSQWFNSPAIALAQKRLSPYARPRRRSSDSETLGTIVQEARIRLGFTQRHFSQSFGTSLRALRDLEQGKHNVSLHRVEAILEPLELQLTAAPLEQKS